MTSSSPSAAARYESGTDRLLVEVSGPVATVTFNNPGKRNALSADMRAALPGVLRALNADGDVRVIVMTGAGDKAFTAGADISEFGEQRTSPAARASYDQAWAAAARCLGEPCQAGHRDDPRVLHRRRAGYRAAGGHQDRLGDSQFGVPAARLGLGYGVSGVTALMNLIGPARTAEVLFSARRFPAAEALQMGLVNRVVPAGSLREAVLSLAASIAGNAPLTVAAAKAAIREIGRPDGQRDLARVQAMVEACFRSADYLEGQRAFAEKRPPAFTGR